MLKFDSAERRLAALPRSSLVAADILERSDLQQAIVHSWEAFRDELGMPELIFLDQEVQPHDSCKDRIDLLALDDSGHLVVIELKRGRERLQLLQAVAYAGMVSQWDADDLRARVDLRSSSHPEEVERLLTQGGIKFGAPKVVLLAESYEPEVIIGAHWLCDFEVPIVAYSIHVSVLEGQTFLSIEQRYPLPELKDVYTARVRSLPRPRDADPDWEGIANDLKLPWARYAIDTLRRFKGGDPVRRRFLAMFADGPFGAVSLNLTNQHVRVYTWDRARCSEAELAEALGGCVPVTTWGSEQTQNSGYAFNLRTKEEFDRFVRLASGGR